MANKVHFRVGVLLTSLVVVIVPASEVGVIEFGKHMVLIGAAGLGRLDDVQDCCCSSLD